MARVRIPIAWKLLAVYLVPAIVTFLGFSFLAHRSASHLLEDELGRRLAGVAATAAGVLADEGLDLLQPGDEQTRTYRNVQRRLQELVEATGVARIYVFDADGSSVCDTRSVPIGERYYGISRSTAEIEAARRGVPTSSVLFVGTDGQRYKSAFAGIPGDHAARYVVGVDGAAPMYAQLGSLRRSLLTTGLGGVLAVVLLSFVAARILTGPIVQLSRAAARIGRGDLDAAVERLGSDEIGEVAETLEQMRVLLRARDERMQMMLAGIAHEVRNPLGGLQLYAGLLREELPAEPTELGDHVRKIERELDHLKIIVSDFLEYARRPRPQLLPVDVVEICNEVAQLVAADAAVKAITVTVAASTAKVRADRGQLRRALLNLLQNAIQASAEGSPVELQSHVESDAAVEIAVVDHGSGIPTEALERIWTPFYTTKQKGTGLGLAFVSEIVEDHGGRIAVVTSPTGTTFRLHLLRS